PRPPHPTPFPYTPLFRSYHHLARAAPLLRRAGGRLMSSFHQPPDIFDFAVPAKSAARILPSLDAALVTTTDQAQHLARWMDPERSEEHTSELQSLRHLVC